MTLLSIHAVWLICLLAAAALLRVTATETTHPGCGYQERVCECSSIANECYFQLEIEELQTFTSYNLVPSENGGLVRGRDAASSYFINDNGELVPSDRPEPNPAQCIIYGEKFLANNCTEPMTVDSRTYNTFIGVNGLTPGPTLIVHYDQTVIIDVKNSLVSEGLSIHWHGMHQMNTPWMDGIAHISQCPINPGSTFRYIFKAKPTGTMWYHSHVGVQRTEGMYGALIVKETRDTMREARSLLKDELGIEELFVLKDKPDRHTLSLLDWQEDVLAIDLQQAFNGQHFPGVREGELPRMSPPFKIPRAPDGSEVSRIPYWSGIINGRGKNEKIPYQRSRLSTFYVDYNWNQSTQLYYRFRLIGAQNRFIYRFSIAGHKLIVVGTDGFLTRPLEVDYVFIHTGERYDFLLKAKTGQDSFRDNYLILAETLDGNDAHTAEAILSYADEPPPTSDYENIEASAFGRCSESRRCEALNCPFQKYNESDNVFIDCKPVTDLRLLFKTPIEELPSSGQQVSEHFFNFGANGEGGTRSINGRNFLSPHGSLQMQPGQEQKEKVCELGNVDCSSPQECVCTQIHNLTADYGETVQFVISVVGQGGQSAHPVHLHGHSFHVAGIFYDDNTQNDHPGDSVSTNPDITCHNNPRCTDPEWTNNGPLVFVNRRTIRKDTVIVPPGGYVVIRFLADNPAYWFMHCHIEPHLLDGMAVVINELYDRQNPPPTELGRLQCGNFIWSVQEFEEKLNFDPSNTENPTFIPTSNTVTPTFIPTSSTEKPKPCKAAGFSYCCQGLGSQCYVSESDCWCDYGCHTDARKKCCPDISETCPSSEPDQCLLDKEYLYDYPSITSYTCTPLYAC